MMTDEEIIKIKSDNSLKDSFIQKYTNFILSSARKATGRFVDKSDDEFSIAIAAFNEAITRYETDKGNFFSFASRVIHSRIVDDQRKNHMHAIPFSALEQEEKDGSVICFDVVGNNDVATDMQLEFLSAKDVLKNFDISFFDLTKCSPKIRKTKCETKKAVDFIIQNKDVLKRLKSTGVLPANLIVTKTGVNKKILDRYRKFIIATVIILSEDYPTISNYIKNSIKEVRE